MNDPLIIGIAHDLHQAELILAGQQRRVEQLKADLEEAKKPQFKPFTVAITVETLEQARTLGAIGGANGSTARFIAEHGSGIFGDTRHSDASRAISELLGPFFQKFALTPNGEWTYQA